MVTKNKKYGKHDKHYKKIDVSKKGNDSKKSKIEEKSVSKKHDNESKKIKHKHIEKKPQSSNFTKLIVFGIIGLLLIGGLLLISNFLKNVDYDNDDQSNQNEDSQLILSVNGDNVYMDEIENKLKGYQAQYGQSITEEFVINQTINERLLLQEAKKQDIKIDNDEIDAAINDWVTNIRASMSDEDINSLLAQEGYTFESYVEELRSQYRNNYLMYALLNKTVFSEIDLEIPEITITDDEVLEEFDENEEVYIQRNISHILICHEESLNCENNLTKQEAKDKIDEIYQKLLNGASFSELAEEFSDCPSSQKGGNLGYIAKDGQMVKEFEDAAFALNNINQFSNPVETDFGYHVIKLLDKKETFEELKEEIKNTLKTNREMEYEQQIGTIQNEAINSYINELKKDAEIIIYEEKLDNDNDNDAGNMDGSGNLELSNLKEFNECLADSGMVIYGSSTCPYCGQLVELLGGSDAVKPVYVECTENQERCISEMIGKGVPEIQLNGELYEGQRTIENLAEATNCSIPI
ncbi:MAG: peptidylprolyl isomerase [Candidatus Woesearchaeota archaeon]